MTFGATLRAARERAGVSQVEMAERLGVAQSNVAELEASESLTERTVLRYAAALGLVARLTVRSATSVPVARNARGKKGNV